MAATANPEWGEQAWAAEEEEEEAVGTSDKIKRQAYL
jgi:hypothetical protein